MQNLRILIRVDLWQGNLLAFIIRTHLSAFFHFHICRPLFPPPCSPFWKTAATWLTSATVQTQPSTLCGTTKMSISFSQSICLVQII